MICYLWWLAQSWWCTFENVIRLDATWRFMQFNVKLTCWMAVQQSIDNLALLRWAALPGLAGDIVVTVALATLWAVCVCEPSVSHLYRYTCSMFFFFRIYRKLFKKLSLRALTGRYFPSLSLHPHSLSGTHLSPLRMRPGLQTHPSTQGWLQEPPGPAGSWQVGWRQAVAHGL